MKRTVFSAALVVLLAVLLWPSALREAAVPREDIPVLEEAPRLLALTFDDGPGRHTQELLDGLAQRGAKATFFLMANKINDDNRALVQRMDDEGHCVASHTYSHPRLHLLTNQEITEEISRADEVLRDITGKTPALLRPPYGNFTSRVQEQVDKPFVLWSVDPEDWQEDADIGEIIVTILQESQDGDIILMHELSRSSVVAALAAVDELQARGFRFVTVPELFQARGIEMQTGNYYWSTNKKSHWDRPIYDADDPYLD